MATISPFIRSIQNVTPMRISIMIGHKTQKKFIPTDIFCAYKDITPDGKLKKSFYSAPLENILHTYRSRIAALGTKARQYTAEDIKKYLVRQDATDGGRFIDFAAFCDKRNEDIKKEKGKNGTWYANTAAIGWLKKFEGSESIDINDITKRRLELFEAYMVSAGVGPAGVNSYFRALRTLFLSAMDEYNNEAKDEYYVKHYPFRKYKIKEVSPEKRAMEVEMFLQILSCTPITKREKIGQDMLLLSFLLAGIAPVDLYNLNPPKSGYIEYYRDKVKHRAKRIKVKIPVCSKAEEIMQKHSRNGFLSDIKRYASKRELSRACAEGLESLCKRIRVEPVTLYWARHTFSSIAGELGYDTNLIDYALGHAPSMAKMAEVYITRKQKTVDSLVMAVIEKVIQ